MSSKAGFGLYSVGALEQVMDHKLSRIVIRVLKMRKTAIFFAPSAGRAKML